MNIFWPFRRRDRYDHAVTPELETMLNRTFAGASSPDTPRQWQRLARAIETAPAPVRPARMAVRLAFSLSVIAALAAGYLLLRPEASREHFSTNRGEQLAVLLPDSSEVLLNHTSSLSYDREAFGSERAITLTGEAFLKVRKTGSPFTVHTPLATVLVVGTEFNVRSREKSYEVGVLEGTVRVNSHDASVMVRGGELLAGTADGMPETPTRMEHSEYPGWVVGKLIFDREELGALCREIEDRFDVRIRIDDPELNSMRLTGAIEAKDARSVLATICALSGKHLRRDENLYILY